MIRMRTSAFPPPRVPGRVVGDRIPDQQAEGQGDEDVNDRPDPDVEPDSSRREPTEDLAEPTHVPFERVPDGNRLEEDRVDRSERDPKDRIERNDEEENQPENARERKSGPQPAPVHDALTLAPRTRQLPPPARKFE